MNERLDSRSSMVVLVGSGEQEPPGLDPARALIDVHVADDLASLEAALPEAEVVFAWDFRSTLLQTAWPQASRLRWVHAGSVGVDTLLSPEMAASDVLLTNTRGVFERPIAEYVLGLLLLFAKDLRHTLQLQSQRQWQHRETKMLHRRHLLVIGAGPVGKEIGQLARAIGMNVSLVGRRARDNDPDFGTIRGSAELDGLLGEADAVVLALPLTDETCRILDARTLARLRPGAWLVNVGRGALVDESALVEALRSGHVAAAALDVFEHEPLPADHPLWSLPQVVVSPHMSGDRLGWREAVTALFVDNLRRWRTGEPLLHVVDKQRVWTKNVGAAT